MAFPSDARISPDGTRVAFVKIQREGDSPKSSSHLWIVKLDKSEPEPLTHGLQNENSPRWSPDGTQIAFIAKGSNDKPQVHLISAEGGEAHQLCAMPNGISQLEWSPDGKRLAFLSVEGAEPAGDPIVLGPGRHTRLWTIRADHTVPEPVTPDGITVWEFVWSPDSQTFALFFATQPDENDWYRGQVGTVPAAGGAVRQRTHLDWQQACSFVWSPDGTRLAYMTGRWSDPGLCAGDIAILNLSTDEIHLLTPDSKVSFDSCHWYPDGQSLLFCAWSGVTNQIGRIAVADGAITLLEEDFVQLPFASRLSHSSDLSRFVVVHANPYQPSDLWAGRISEGGTVSWQRLTRLNPLVEETYTLATSQRIRYPSVDGWEIDAIFTLPINPPAGKLPPLFVNVHGGPSFAWTDGFGGFYNQLLASHGYAVLSANIRGSWGRGTEFADAVIGDIGGKDFQDLLKGVDYLVEQGLVDGERVAIGGWSYGGFMPAWAVTQTNRFKAAIMGAGISDWHGSQAQAGYQDANTLFMGVDYLKDPETFRKNSPITYADRVITPTLILHGENDPAVPVSQAYAFYRALKERNVPVECVIYPREGHGLSELAHWRDSEERLLRWLERYV